MTVPHPPSDRYLLDCSLRQSARMSLSGSGVVWDEAHNLAAHARQQRSILLSPPHLALLLAAERRRSPTHAPPPATLQRVCGALQRIQRSKASLWGVGESPVRVLLSKCEGTPAVVAAMTQGVQKYEWLRATK